MIANTSYTQSYPPLDSLLNQMLAQGKQQNTPDSEKTYNALGNLLMSMKDDKRNIHRPITNYITTKDSSDVAFLYHGLNYAVANSDPKLGLEFLQKGVCFVPGNNLKRLASYYCDIRANQWIMGLDLPALDSYFKSLEFVNKAEDEKKEIDSNLIGIKITTLTNIMEIYLRQKNIDLASRYNQEALSLINQFPKDKRFLQLKIIGLNYAAEIARLNKNPGLANNYLLQSLNISREIENKDRKSEVLAKLGDYAADINKKLEYHELAYDILKDLEYANLFSISSSMKLAGTCLELAEHDSLRKKLAQPQSRDYYIKRSSMLLDLTRRNIPLIDSKQDLSEFYRLFSRLKKIQGDYRTAYEYIVRHHALNDSIFSQENKNKLAALESRSALELKDKEIKFKELTLNQKEKQTWLLVSALAAVSVLGGLLFYQNQLRKKKNKELDEANQIKTRFFSILNHDLRTPVSNLLQFLYLQKNDPNLFNEEDKTALQDQTIHSTENLLATMEDLLLWSKSQMENFKPHPKSIKIKDVFTDVDHFFSGKENITVIFEDPQKAELFIDENYLKTILRNLTSNAVKALENTENGQIIWRAQQENGKTILSITDNGPGGSDEQFRALYDEKEVVGIKTGLGLHLVRDMAKAIDCTVSVDTIKGKGTTISLLFNK